MVAVLGMSARRYVEGRPRPERVSYAAQYRKGEPLNDLREVVAKYDRGGDVAEQAALGVLVVRYLNVPDNHPARVEYEVVPDGHFLAYSETFDLLYVDDAQNFAREHKEQP